MLAYVRDGGVTEKHRGAAPAHRRAPLTSGPRPDNTELHGRQPGSMLEDEPEHAEG